MSRKNFFFSPLPMKHPVKPGHTGVTDIWVLDKPGYSSVIDVSKPVDPSAMYGYDSKKLEVFYAVCYVLFRIILFNMITIITIL